jgi:uncharacterized protein YndB with AHSA1/START domain
MSDRVIATPKKESIVVENVYPQPPEKVWRALTDPKILETWLMPNDIRAEVGARFNFHTKPGQGWSGTIDCEVLQVETNRLLVYTWGGGSKAAEGYGQRLDTVVTWTLTPTEEGGTHLRLEHAGFDPDSFALKVMGQGWSGKISDRIRAVLESMAD